MPAAGESLRMGAWKLILRLEDETVAERSVRNALAFCTRVILVGGYRVDALRALFANWASVLVVENEDYRRGMFSSIRTGAPFVKTQRFFVALADMPFVPPQIFRTLAELRVESAPSQCAVRPLFHGIPGHPVLLPRLAIDKIRQFDNSHTMKDVLGGLRVSTIETNDERVVRDIDTPEDVRRYGVDL